MILGREALNFGENCNPPFLQTKGVGLQAARCSLLRFQDLVCQSLISPSYWLVSNFHFGVEVHLLQCEKLSPDVGFCKATISTRMPSHDRMLFQRQRSTVPPLFFGAFNFLQLEIFDHFPEVEGVPSSTDSTDVLQSVGLLGDVNLEVEGLAV